MNDDATAAAQELDDSDLRLLHEIRSMYDEVDPVPPTLAERVRFALALDELYDEVAQITREPVAAGAVRSDETAQAVTDTLTFSTERLTAMVTVTRNGATLRLDGWLVPPGPCVVNLRLRDGEGNEVTTEVTSDETGRFVFPELGSGLAQLRFHPDPAQAIGVVVTPPFEV